MMKQNDYAVLVQKRKTCRLCEGFYGLKNQSVIAGGQFDNEIVIGAWSLWQGSLNAKILLIGQDWGDQASFEKCLGLSGSDDNATDINLIELFKSINIEVDHPRSAVQNPLLFFTNTVLCMKEGGLATKIPSKCYSSCAKLYLAGIIEIIKPEVIITLGKNAYRSIARLYGQKPEPYTKLLMRIKQNMEPLKVSAYAGLPSVILLPAPHCGQYSSNTFMSISEQKTIWHSLVNIIQQWDVVHKSSV